MQFRLGFGRAAEPVQSYCSVVLIRMSMVAADDDDDDVDATVRRSIVTRTSAHNISA